MHDKIEMNTPVRFSPHGKFVGKYVKYSSKSVYINENDIILWQTVQT